MRDGAFGSDHRILKHDAGEGLAALAMWCGLRRE
jgi:hypothetical protein